MQCYHYLQGNGASKESGAVNRQVPTDGEEMLLKNLKKKSRRQTERYWGSRGEKQTNEVGAVVSVEHRVAVVSVLRGNLVHPLHTRRLQLRRRHEMREWFLFTKMKVETHKMSLTNVALSTWNFKALTFERSIAGTSSARNHRNGFAWEFRREWERHRRNKGTSSWCSGGMLRGTTSRLRWDCEP